MFNRVHQEIVRDIRIHRYSCQERDGKPITEKGKPFIMLTPNQVKAEIEAEILSYGFSKIKKVSPTWANCIIRVYEKVRYDYEDGLVYNLYGAECYTQDRGVWVTRSGGDLYRINHAKSVHRHWICQDEYIDFDCDFFDTYVRIS